MKDIINGFLITPPEVSFFLWKFLTNSCRDDYFVDRSAETGRQLFRDGVLQSKQDGRRLISVPQPSSRYNEREKKKKTDVQFWPPQPHGPHTEEDSPHYNIIKDHHRHLSGLQVKHAGHPKASGLPNINPETMATIAPCGGRPHVRLFISSSFFFLRFKDVIKSHTAAGEMSVVITRWPKSFTRALHTQLYPNQRRSCRRSSNSLVASSPFFICSSDDGFFSVNKQTRRF